MRSFTAPSYFPSFSSSFSFASTPFFDFSAKPKGGEEGGGQESEQGAGPGRPSGPAHGQGRRLGFSTAFIGRQ